MRLLLAVLCLLPYLVAFQISIDANEEHCYFERLKIGDTFTVMFEVAGKSFCMMIIMNF